MKDSVRCKTCAKSAKSANLLVYFFRYFCALFAEIAEIAEIAIADKYHTGKDSGISRTSNSGREEV